MKRDMDLVRRILVETECASAPLDISAFLDEEHATVEDVAYHVELMQHHGLIDASIQRNMGGSVAYGKVIALTWDGCDYLDAIRDDRVWAKSKDAIRKAVGSTTMGLMKETAVAIGKQAILAGIGM